MRWITKNYSPNHTLHQVVCTESSEHGVEQAVLNCMEKATQLLSESIENNAMYCLFIWQEKPSLSLTILVTDESKALDGKHIVEIQFTEITGDLGDGLAEKVKFWIRDNLTTNRQFLLFSLVAGFARNGRDRIELL